MFLLLSILVFVAILGVYRKSDIETVLSNDTISKNQIRVIDGDTFELNGTKIRLYGIDAFERNQHCFKHDASINCGELATDYLSFLLTGRNISCVKKSSDRYGRNVSICTVDGVDISKMMVKQGWAKAYTEYSLAYSEDEKFAKDNLLGAWTKEFVNPKEYREKKSDE